ncbi:MAG: peptidylprolyl isomerase [Rhodospirillales bacterium]
MTNTIFVLSLFCLAVSLAMPLLPRLLCLVLLPLLLTARPGVADMNTLAPAMMVNDKVVSALTVEMRIKLALVSSGLPDNEETRAFLQRQVEQALIDETLQVQEAERLGIAADPEQVEEAFDQIATGNGLQPQQLRQQLERAGILPAYLEDQINAQILWRSVLRQQVLPRIVVTAEDTDEAVARIEARQGDPQRLLAEIFLPIDNASQTDEVMRNAESILEQLARGGTGFQALARQVSQSPTASAGGDMGWVDPGLLPQEVEAALDKIGVNQLTPPVVTRTGIYILLLRDERPTPERIVSISVKMITFPVRNFENRSAVNQAAGRATQAAAALNSCEAVESVARRFNGRVEPLPETLEVSRMPPGLRSATNGLAIGQPSELFRAPDGIGLAIVCSREDSGIDRERVRERLITEQVELLSRRYLQDLRRVATIEMRS